MGHDDHLLFGGSHPSLLLHVLCCVLEDLDNIWMPLDLTILDTARGEIYRGNTVSIQGIVSAAHSGEVPINRGPYFEVEHQDSQFILRLNDNFTDYEEYETSQVMSLRVVFSCTSTASNYNLLIFISITDTNNNSPRFLPADSFELTVTPPLSPGYQLTGCGYDIVARDIDLTNYAIIFGIEENDYFEISYANVDPDDEKNHHAMLRTKAFVRSLPEPLTLQISATDVDNTNDPPRTTYGTLTLISDDRFQLPDEPQFNEAFYLATYTWDHNLIMDQTISLRQGFDAQVEFGLSGEHADNFQVTADSDGVLTVQVRSQLPAAVVYEETHIYLVVTADRELTTGASATIIVKLPEPRILSFEEEMYRGTIEFGVLNLNTITLTAGYQDDVQFSLSGDYSTMFSTSNVGNLVTINLQEPLAESIILENNFLVLTLEATGLNAVPTRAIIVLDIIKEDEIIPLFSQNIYSGTLNETTLDLETIYLAQGYEDSVIFSLEGAHSEWFVAQSLGNSVTIALRSQIPAEVLDENSFLAFTVKATRDLLEAHATVTISIIDDSVVEVLRFEQITYTGSIEQNAVVLNPIILTEDLSRYFVLNVNGQTLSLQKEGTIPENIMNEIDFIILEIHANAPESIPGYAVIVLTLEEILKPTFNRPYYTGYYNETDGLLIEQQIIVENYDEDVILSLEGDHAQWFTLGLSGNTIEISLYNTIPDEVVDDNMILTFTIKATRGTLNTESTIIISLLKDHITNVLRFERIAYLGSIVESQVVLDDIILTDGYSNEVHFDLRGDLSSYFTLNVNDGLITLSKEEPLPEEILNDKALVVLELYAEAPESVSGHTTIILELSNIVAPRFNQPYYIVQYNETEGLIHENQIILEDYDSTATISLEGEPTVINVLRFEQINYIGTLENNTVDLKQIVLAKGYSNDNLQFALDGELAEYFTINVNERLVTLQNDVAIPEEILNEAKFIVLELHATAYDSVPGYTVIILESKTLPRAELEFNRLFYVGQYNETDGLSFDMTIHLEQGYEDSVRFELEGDHSQWFDIDNLGNEVIISLNNNIPSDVLTNNRFLVFSIKASLDTLSTEAVIIINLLQDLPEVDVLRFEQINYEGTIEEDLVILDPIVLTEGYRSDFAFSLHGGLSSYFELNVADRVVTLSKSRTIPEEILNNVNVIVLELHATAPETVSGYATIILSLSRESAASSLAFNQVYYTGQYGTQEGLLIDTPIYLQRGFDSSVTFELEGAHANWFVLQSNENVVTISPDGALPTEVLANNRFLVFTVKARQGSLEAEATVIIEILDEQIVLSEGYRADVVFLCMEISHRISKCMPESRDLTKSRTIPDELLDGINVIVLELHATAPETITGYDDRSQRVIRPP
ncbi:hypothetical protein EVAR_7609_1 [Eumeta japonica]|uniref:Cadherin domain-containing protein n=1 Tax=Eumeta variegata TaxID=151549 RepID=A0A4C1TJB6_EUMVA|nr:hypothetical protein EVAR_7609_1 [Eumeta japonica]